MCILLKRGGEVGRTTTVYGSLNPVWGRNASQQGEVRANLHVLNNSHRERGREFSHGGI